MAAFRRMSGALLAVTGSVRTQVAPACGNSQQTPFGV